MIVDEIWTDLKIRKKQYITWIVSEENKYGDKEKKTTSIHIKNFSNKLSMNYQKTCKITKNIKTFILLVSRIDEMVSTQNSCKISKISATQL